MIIEDGNESILAEAERLTHGERNKDYGHPLDDYTCTAALASAVLSGKLKAPITAHEMALVMVCVKLSRESRNPKRDNRTDGSGYFWVADQCLQEAERRAAAEVQITVDEAKRVAADILDGGPTTGLRIYPNKPLLPLCDCAYCKNGLTCPNL